MENGYQQESLAVYDWGIEFYSPWGMARKVRNEEISEIRVIPEGGGKVVKFYSEGRCVGICLSEGKQGRLLMDYLRCRMADKIKQSPG